MKYLFYTYGCQMNVADSEEMAGALRRKGLEAASSIEEAQVVLVNTCTVRQQAEDRAISQIGRLRRWKEEDSRRILIVAGCAATRLQQSLQKRFRHVDLVSPATEMDRFPEMVETVLRERWDYWTESKEGFQQIHSSPLVGEDPGEGEKQAPLTLPSPTRGEESIVPQVVAYVTIMRGCNYHCSYCIVPAVRGREVYRPVGEILSEIEDRVRQGAKEVLLLGQTVNSYYYRPASGVMSHASVESTQDTSHMTHDGPVDFADLLRAVNRIKGLSRIRFISPHPRHMRDRAIRAIAECGKVCEHVHLPVQSGSDRILRLMRRYYTAQEYREVVRKFRDTLPGMALTTDVIVGYPTETEEDFRATLHLLEAVHFDGLFAFRYSPRPGTESSLLPDDVPQAVKEERLQQVLALAERLTREQHRRLLGTRQEVLIEEIQNGDAFGRTRTNKQVRVSSQGILVGDVVPVLLESMHAQSFAGRLA